MNTEDKNKNSKKPYAKFGLMMAVSFVIMYAVMFLNADVFDHVMLSNTRTYMTILMIAPMAISMMLFMWGMYKDKKLNYIILGGSALLFIATLYGLRQQVFISDVQWMKAMIPHHSSAIMVSQKADLKDPEARKLAKEIIEAQEREIAQMKKMIYRLENSDE
ncbi:DUF305 domain-containing protein [Zeaxanthinibacter sp. PT1]|uniref:DUF305 domain-containing protein n=1 Tax=Zeaxanthinibacter TaxID=561554 RepID=UPI00234916EB|nr:DUF305 domain-containing protein [Zeaxanthinibacter sp. PT1]MDC6350172.1 DUF305 domain-containing protein [Zeaxanthinibacter sp. PT1]